MTNLEYLTGNLRAFAAHIVQTGRNEHGETIFISPSGKSGGVSDLNDIILDTMVWLNKEHE